MTNSAKSAPCSSRFLPVVALLLCAASRSVALAQTFMEFPVPETLGGNPSEITAGPDGALWFTEFRYEAFIGRISTDGVITGFPIPEPWASWANPAGITTGPDGNLWFTLADFDMGFFSSICRMTPAGVFTVFPLSNNLSAPCDITAGSDGNLWFTECNINGNAIGRITPDGDITEFPLPTSGMGHYPYQITAGPDGNLWFTEPYLGRIGKITITLGVITEFGAADPAGITAGPDGNLWFTESTHNKIGRITPAGVVTEFPIPTFGSQPNRIAAGPDGNLWFTERSAGKLGRITTAGLIAEFPLPTPQSQPSGITAGPDGNLWLTELGASQIARRKNVSFSHRQPPETVAPLDDPRGTMHLHR